MQAASVMQIYHDLLAYYGEQHWWPADSDFEMMVGAILTQNTSWSNVEKALHNLRQANILHPEAMLACSQESLETWVHPAGFFRQKSARLLRLCQFYLQHGKLHGMQQETLKKLRNALLDVNGIGPETADSILLYAIEKPIFVVDSYTKRIFHRLGTLPKDITQYNDVQQFFHQRTANTLSLYQQFHALIVIHAKQHCLKKPQCDECPLSLHCQHAHQTK